MKPRHILIAALVVGLLICVFCHPGHAAQRSVLLTRLNAKIGDANNVILTQANKILILDEVGREFGNALVYTKRDTVVTVVGTEIYATNSDFAGAIRLAYVKRNKDPRRMLEVVDYSDLISDPGKETDVVTKIFVDFDGYFGVQPIPSVPESVFVTYYAYPGALSEDTTEWNLPDGYEGAALDVAAGRCIRTQKTATSAARADAYEQRGWERLEQLKNPSTLTREAGDTPR